MDFVSPVVLAVGTTHPLNVAGVGLDARIAPLLGVRIVTVVAGVSAQDAGAVLARTPLDEATIGAQFAAVRDAGIGAVHVGALLDARSVSAVAGGLRSLGGVPAVCDPVIAATGGQRLADDETIRALREVLFAHCALVTPNLGEAALLLGRSIPDVDAMEEAARELGRTGAGAVLIKGGHLDGDPTDVLLTADGVTRLSAKRIAATLRGTGDLLACAAAARLACGDSIAASVEAARAFVRGCLAAGVPFAGTRTVP
ncbi:MAG: bifunctional hydroxymethylpyrimidine kinase/phosphomethylpyrimidine kinase [Candidatus Velthaea sp.]